MDVDVIKAFYDKDTYNRYREFISKEHVSDIGMDVLKALDKYYNKGGTEPDTQILRDIIFLQKFSDETKELYSEFLDSVDTSSPAHAEIILEFLEKRRIYTKVAELALEIAEGSNSVEPSDIMEVIDSTKQVGLPDGFYGLSFTDILSPSVTLAGLSWRCGTLDRAIGPVDIGSLVLASARPEVGKTTFLASEVSHMATQLKDDQTCVIICNEEAPKAVKERWMTSLLGMTKHDMLKDPVNAMAMAEAMLGASFDDKIRVWHGEYNMNQVRSILDAEKPGIVVFDQLRHIRGHDRRTGTEVERLKMIYQDARRIASDYGPVFTVHQADGTASGEKYLEMNQLEGTKTEVQGALDVQIMIGKSLDPTEADTRYIHIVKNKLSGCKDEALRHGKFELKFDSTTGRYYE